MTLQKKILFRADGDSNTGLGHLYRLFALVEIYKRYFDFQFVTKTSSTKTVFPSDYKVVFIPESISITDEPSWLRNKFVANEYIIIADGYEFGSNYQKQLKSEGFKLIYIDDLIQGKMYADRIINHAANINATHYQSSEYTQFFLGTDYAMLRPSFIKAAQTSRNISKISEVFVCFGGADGLDLSLKSVEALLQIPQITAIHVVLGAAYSHSDIFELANSNKSINLYQNLDEVTLCQLMTVCQLAVAPASTIVYELCSVKMPILSGYFVDNQKNIYDALLKKCAIYGGGDFSTYTVDEFRDKLQQLLAQNNANSYVEAQQGLFDGQSPNRFINMLNLLFIKFRNATEADVMLVYNWSNDPEVRKSSYDSDPINLDNHKRWFSQKINDKNTLFLIALYDEMPAGIVRYEMGNENSVIGILISEDFRGRKLSVSFLSESAKLYFKQNNLPIFAYIKEKNKASIKAFASAGYSFYKKEIIKGMPSFVYKLEINDHKR